MLESVRKSIEIPQVPVRALGGVGAVGSFLWLVSQDLVHPLAIYLLEIYLAF